MKNRVLITGANTGIGRALAWRFAREGCDIIAHYYENESLAHELAQQITALGVSADLIYGDFSDDAHIMKVVEDVHRIGMIDILVNNAAIVAYQPLLDSSNSLWDKVMSVNVKAPFVLTREFSRTWISRHLPGAILNITSISATHGTMYQVHYCAAKGALLQLTRESAIELGPHGIRVNAIAPGIIETNANAALLQDPDIKSAYTSVVPLSRLGSPDDLADCAVFLCSDGSRYITGQQIVVDGGWSARAREPQFSKHSSGH